MGFTAVYLSVLTTARHTRKKKENVDGRKEKAKDLLADVNEEIRLPRLTSVQKHRANPKTNDPEQYYRITVAIPLLEDLTSQLKIRFTDHKKVIAALYTLIPTVCSEKETPFSREDLVMYEDLVELDEAQGEFQLWKLFWQGKSPSDRPSWASCAIEAVGECNRQLYPNIFMLLNILSTLPVTTCTPERSFSTLRRLKTYLRNSCGQERLTGLALMAIHRYIIIPTNDVITEFAHKKSRRLDFVL
ncbi:52 kDa repressor of the inhibitor of the protein kinase-like [Coccinella septempunctata]|uniref:52 kDa repressor of the inhibitor of the protein kinase-like n=1 Tax=Coccinella septempunctata TaxID=41139 RepID=UPI001D0631CD|nr:52 kDa repressor of the inhibitor of the protein kinase-like [Coccinella septempunctata]